MDKKHFCSNPNNETVTLQSDQSDFVICNLIFYFTGRVRMKMSNLFALQKGHKIKLLIFLNLDFYGNTCKILKSEEIVTSFRSLMNFWCL